MTEQALSDAQLMTLMQSGPVLDTVTTGLPQELQERLMQLQRRAGDSYAGVGCDCAAMGPAPRAPTTQDAQQVLGEAYLALEEKKTQLKSVMDRMGLTPSAQPKGWMEQVMDYATGWLR